MSAFLATPGLTAITLSTTASNTAVQTSGPSTFLVTNVGTDAVQVGLTQGTGAPFGNVVIPGGWPQMIQCQSPEKVPGTVYVIAKSLTGTPTIYVAPGFEV